MVLTDERITSIVTGVAWPVALAVALSLPTGYFAVSYSNFSGELEFRARVKATAVSIVVANDPDMWIYGENRLVGLLTREPVPLETEEVKVYDEHNGLLASAGDPVPPPVLRRSHPVHDGARVAGRVEVGDSMRPMIFGTALAGVLGLMLGGAVFFALRIVPMRELRRLTGALFAQKQRAEVTLRSIGDAVITTDARECVEFMNPVAERLCGWEIAEARGRRLSEVLRLVDTTTGGGASSPMSQALAENRIVALARDVDVMLRDGTRLAIDDIAAPIKDEAGAAVGGVLVFRDVSTARDFTRQRSWEAAHDVLTGLVNRREFENLVEICVATARKAGKHHVVCYMDLDRFKVVNDTCGHAAGDELLKQVADLLGSRIRESDTLARLGGDEFGLLLEGCVLERARLIAADLLAAVDAFRFSRDGKVFTLGVSIGLTTVNAESLNSSEVLSMADSACYWAKEQGRNRVCVYRTADDDMVARRRETGWVARINHALEEGRFILYHQSYLPLNASAGDRDHLEVLLRMIDEQGELVQPGTFLPAAERYNLMPAIDRWVVEKVLDNYHSLVARRGGRPLTCAINLSGTSLNAEGFLDFVRAMALKHSLPPLSICFEITETAAINNLRRVSEFIKECRALGFLFALDDFGTGTSSFGYLRNLPVDFLKIDGGFVKNIKDDAIDRAMTETINRIGHIMGIKTVAEYAENDAIIRELKDMGVDYAQGFGVCRPTPLLFVPEDEERRAAFAS